MPPSLDVIISVRQNIHPDLGKVLDLLGDIYYGQQRDITIKF